ncbi:MAG TPA: hypothetical protein VFB73_11070 [Chloroflexota bacterium]|nr:hypothetical protein [Chloroflexota bacterium]
MEGLFGGRSLLVASLVPDCYPIVAGLGMALIGSALVLVGWLIGRLVHALHTWLGYPEDTESRGPRLPGQTVQEVAARLRHDSPGGWTAGETRWTLAHQYAWFSSPDYRTFVVTIIVVIVSWVFGITWAHRLCE